MTRRINILSFYGGETTDHRGRYLRDIQQWWDDRLEETHDYIQWLFPLAEPADLMCTRPFWTRQPSRNSGCGLICRRTYECHICACLHSTVSGYRKHHAHNRASPELCTEIEPLDTPCESQSPADHTDSKEHAVAWSDSSGAGVLRLPCRDLPRRARKRVAWHQRRDILIVAASAALIRRCYVVF